MVLGCAWASLGHAKEIPEASRDFWNILCPGFFFPLWSGHFQGACLWSFSVSFQLFLLFVFLSLRGPRILAGSPSGLSSSLTPQPEIPLSM